MRAGRAGGRRHFGLKERQQRILGALLAGDREGYAALLAPRRVTYVDGTLRNRQEVLDQG